MSGPAETALPTSAKEIPTRVLVLGMAHHDGSIVVSELAPVAQACGQSREQIRSCLRRLVAEGLFARKGTGLDARYEATEEGMRALGTAWERTRLAYVQDATGQGWDRNWHLVAFAVPEARRAARDSLRQHLLELGGAAVQGGLYVSPHSWDKEVRDRAQRLEIADLITLAITDDLEIGGQRHPQELAALLWPIEELARRYQAFVTRFSRVAEGLRKMAQHNDRLPDAIFLPGALWMAVAFQACFEMDPLLPPELLPRPWPGRMARELLVRSRRLALSVREMQGRPALFQIFDEALEALP
jgi:phenylacetic acid degradation operon negative regulatory protein